MKLSDVVSHSGLSVYAEIALILFFLVFVAIVVRIFLPGRRAEQDRMARMPLEEPATREADGARP